MNDRQLLCFIIKCALLNTIRLSTQWVKLICKLNKKFIGINYTGENREPFVVCKPIIIASTAININGKSSLR